MRVKPQVVSGKLSLNGVWGLTVVPYIYLQLPLLLLDLEFPEVFHFLLS
jgi:ABC-type uncharacterized transport system permease subunit